MRFDMTLRYDSVSDLFKGEFFCAIVLLWSDAERTKWTARVLWVNSFQETVDSEFFEFRSLHEALNGLNKTLTWYAAHGYHW